MKSGFKLLIVLNSFLFAASSCSVFLIFLVVVHVSFHSHSRETLELTYVNYQFYLGTFYVKTSIQARSV